MAKIQKSNNIFLKEFDPVAVKLEQELIKKEIKKTKKGRPRKPRVGECICCGNKFKERLVDIDMNDYQDTSKLLDEFDLYELEDFLCDSCKSFWDPKFRKDTWEPRSAFKRLKQLKEKGYAISLGNNTFSTPSGNNISIEIGDVFLVARNGIDLLEQEQSSNIKAKDLFSIDIMIGHEKLTLFPWEVGSISWLEIQLELREKQYNVVYLNDTDIEGYYEPVPEVREMLNNTFIR